MGSMWGQQYKNQQAFQGGAGVEGNYYFRPGQTGTNSVLVGNAAGGRETYDPAKHGAAPAWDDKRWSFEDQNGYGKSIGMDATNQANWTPHMRSQFTANLVRTQPGGVRPAPTTGQGFAGVTPSGPSAAPAGPTPPTQPGVAPTAAQGPSGGFGGVKPIGPRTGNGIRTSFGQAELR
jgi:hypothetical protein